MAIELKNVYKVYKSGGEEVVALKDVNLKIEDGDVVALMGPSGSGKTTLLNIIATLDRPTRGRVVVLGKDVTSMDEKELEKFRLRYIGYLFQSYNLVPYLTALQNVALPLIALGIKKEFAYLRAKLLLELVGLDGAVNKYPSQLSGGMQQRAAIARAIAVNPRVLILDEPTSNVDVENASRILGIIVALNKLWNTTTILATHDPDVALTARRVVYMSAGQIYDRGEAPRKRLEVNLEKAFSIYDKLSKIDSLIGL